MSMVSLTEWKGPSGRERGLHKLYSERILPKLGYETHIGKNQARRRTGRFRILSNMDYGHRFCLGRGAPCGPPASRALTSVDGARRVELAWDERGALRDTVRTGTTAARTRGEINREQGQRIQARMSSESDSRLDVCSDLEDHAFQMTIIKYMR